jgi:hypothetical protein
MREGEGSWLVPNHKAGLVGMLRWMPLLEAVQGVGRWAVGLLIRGRSERSRPPLPLHPRMAGRGGGRRRPAKAVEEEQRQHQPRE